MHTQFTPPSRNSYSYQSQPHIFNSIKFNTSNTILPPRQETQYPRTQQSKVIGMQRLAKSKAQDHYNLYTRDSSKIQQGQQKYTNTLFPTSNSEQQLNQMQLRGSCANINRKIDYSNLRKTTQFNPLKLGTIQQKPQAPKQKLLLKPKIQAPLRVPQFIKNDDKKLNFGKIQKKYEQPLSPAHSKAQESSSTMTSSSSKNTDQQRKFKSLNEIYQNKIMERITVDKSRRSNKIVNGFELGRVLGRGKFGEVYLGRHIDTGFVAALKKINKAKICEYKMVDQLAKEIKLHSALNHPYIVKFYGVFHDQTDIYLVMEYMNGGTLFDYLNEVTCVSVRETVEFLRDVIQAVTYMHQKFVIHRDIKPQNIVISTEGVAKLCDFGWSALLDTNRKTYCGTFDYAPPEVLEKKNYDESVDIWCLGVLTYQLLTGHAPYQGEQRNVVMQKIRNVNQPNLG